jgi:hypothetical protein
MRDQIDQLEKLKEKINWSNADLLEIQEQLLKIKKANSSLIDFDIVGE